MTGPQGRSMRPRKPALPRTRFTNPDASTPTRWTLKRVQLGKYAIVDAEGVSVLDHWDPQTRLFNRHLAKAAPVMQFALNYAHRYIATLENAAPFSDWVLRLITDALAESIPRPPVSRQLESPVTDEEEAA